MSDLVEFLLARIAEDEDRAERWRQDWHERGGVLDLALTPGPARVLAECDGKRRRLDLADALEGEADDDTYRWAASIARRIRAIEALPYADHPDYDEAWRP